MRGFGDGIRRRRGTRVWRSAAGLAATAMLLSGCLWTQVGFGPQHRRENPVDDGLNLDTVGTVTQVWSAALPGAGMAGTDTEPIVTDERVYVGRSIGDADGGVWVAALDAATGATVWDRQLLAANTISVWPMPLSLTGDVLTAGYMGLVGLDPGCTAAYAGLDPADGSGTIFADGVLISPAVTSGSLVARLHKPVDDPASNGCGAGEALVRVRTVSPGHDVWDRTIGPSRGASDSWPTSYVPTVADGRVFVAWGPQLHAFALDGCGAGTCAPIWTASLSADMTATTPPVATNGGQVLALTKTGQLVSFAAGSGALRWRADTGWSQGGSIDPRSFNVRPSIAVSGDLAYVTTTGSEDGATVGRVQAFAANGCGAAVCTPLWTATVPDVLGTPAVTGGVLFVGRTDAVLALDASGCGATTCAPIATLPFAGWAANLSIAGGRLYAAGDGHVTAFAPEPAA